MSNASLELIPGQNIQHVEMGAGVFLGITTGGYARVFFQQVGERQVPITALSKSKSWDEQVIAGIRPATKEALERLWLAVEAEQLPLLESAATLTSAKVDLLPHQIVLTYRVANSSPRRFLVADSVGLGKTIETALILRELASRGELNRALMIVPAGLVNNWRRELNDTFNLNFEVFGSEGDVTDRKSNAFAKHNRIIASIDTLKRPSRVKRLLEAPPWDLIVFDEAHHLTAYRTGKKVQKTQNFKLAESMKEHSRDLMLLSATPHQGDHFRFWMLIRLLDPALFESPDDMVDNRHRLNAVMFRRTQADACNSKGETLFSRRQVHTNAFHLVEFEQHFYDALNEYLADGYNLAQKLGGKGRAIGFVMTIFQKIASSSFAAIGSTLRRRLLMLTLHESIVCDENLDADGRDRALNDARQLIRQMNGLPDDRLGYAQADRMLADLKVQLLRKLGEEVPENAVGDEMTADSDEDSAASLVKVALPAERQRIQELLEKLPQKEESKTKELLRAVADLWAVHPDEKIVVFTTYLGSVDTLRNGILAKFPDSGVEVLKGGDHGAKLAAEKRFRRPDGPRVLICTAAGREGINLQFARVLINHDLPWNPMDVEQRIGRIHRYGQQHTAQVYNLVSADTIEGQIYLLLEQKLTAIAQALGKVDENGQVAEDLRAQILGQLSEKVSYDRLYKEAINDPKLQRTKEELEVALDNARVARNVVFELFQDLEGFRLDDYKRFDDGGQGMDRLFTYLRQSVEAADGRVVIRDGDGFDVILDDAVVARMTRNREDAKKSENITLLGLEHPIVERFMAQHRGFEASVRGLSGRVPGLERPTVVTHWLVHVHGGKRQYVQRVLTLAADAAGERLRQIERGFGRGTEVLVQEVAILDPATRHRIVTDVFPEMIRRELSHLGLLEEGQAISAKLLAWFELTA